MIKIKKVLMLTIGCAMILVGCKQEANVEMEEFAKGDWKLIKKESEEFLVEGEELEISYKGDVIYTFQEDGSAMLQVSELEIEAEWVSRGDEIIVTSNDLDISFVKENGNLVAVTSTGIMTLEKVEQETDSEEDTIEVEDVIEE